MAVSPREAEDEVALLVANALGGAVEGLLVEEHLVGELVGAVDGNDPRAVVRVCVLVDLEERLFREEPAVGHQSLVDGAELVDAEGRVRHGLRALTGLRACEAQVCDDLLEDLVGEVRLVDERTRIGSEEGGAQSGEGQLARVFVAEGLLGRVAVVDETEQRVE